jgi:hypothetical protein
MTRGLKYPPFAKPAPHSDQSPPKQEQLPSIDEFLDDLPSIDDFLAEDFTPDVGAESDSEGFIAVSGPESTGADGWAAGSWQSYDWSSVASLNRSTSSAVDSADAWSESDWPEPVASHSHGSSESPSADEIANALDGIAYRIRTGELVIDNLHGMPPEAAMAAALAVLLRMRG